MKRFAVALSSLLSVSLSIGVAAEASAQCEDIDPRVFAGTIAYRAGVLTRSSFGTAFGVASFLEQRILPELDKGQHVASFQGAAVANSIRVPTIRPGCTTLGDSYESLPSMQYAVNVGFGAKFPYGFELFYAGDVTESHIASDKFVEGFVGHGTLLKGFGTGLLAPLMMAVTDQTVEGPQASYYDFVVGGGWGIGYGSIRAGYVGSKGLFLHIGSYKLGVEGSAVFNFDDALISYLKGGIGPHTTPIGLTSIFAKASLLASGPRIDPVTAREIPGPIARDEWVTVHFKQELAETDGFGLGTLGLKETPWATFEGALTVRPTVDFYTVRGTYHGQFLYATAGLTRPPDLFAIGGNHDLKLSLGAGMNIYVSTVYEDGMPTERHPLVSMRIALNDPEMVRLFPMSTGSIVSFHLEFHLELAEKKEKKETDPRKAIEAMTENPQ